MTNINVTQIPLTENEHYIYIMGISNQLLDVNHACKVSSYIHNWMSALMIASDATSPVRVKSLFPGKDEKLYNLAASFLQHLKESLDSVPDFSMAAEKTKQDLIELISAQITAYTASHQYHSKY